MFGLNQIYIGAILGVIAIGALGGALLWSYNKGAKDRENAILAELGVETEETLMEHITSLNNSIVDRDARIAELRTVNLRIQELVDARDAQISQEVRDAVEGLGNALEGLDSCPALGSDFIRLHNRAAGDQRPEPANPGNQ